ncbi:retrotransposon protein, putative, ty1-copia subclass [Tanacetum coccineum]|uniref:Retrotransposon protein, putative, ty1-copia subclass n=1 Tax=Tanacetum coccineum TaxID=301880 RepID=A0ABQ5EJZ8_9ASTR
MGLKRWVTISTSHLKTKIVIASYAEFLEKNLISQEVSGRAVELEEIQDEDTSPFENTSEIPMEVEGFEPPQEEVVPVRMSARSKWFFKEKTDMDGIVHTYKARLVEKGYIQTYGVDYEETFSHVAEIRAIRILIATTAFYDNEIWQMDVKTAFLNGCLDEDIYMHQEAGIKDLMRKSKGEAAFILGIKIYRIGKRLIGLQLRVAYMDKILKRYSIDNSKRGNIPMQERLDLNKTQGASTPREVKRMKNVSYPLDVGSIINPEVELRVDCYCNAGFETDRDEIKSQTGYANLNEGVWLGIVPTINEPIKMFCDNSAALLIANEPGVQRGARHYHRRYLLKVHTYENLADPFTKALPKESYSSMLRAWGLSF